jgi:AraC-like DNA-binding protein
VVHAHDLPRAPAAATARPLSCLRLDRERHSRPRVLERVLPTGTAQVVVNLAEDRTRGYDEHHGLFCSSAPGSVIAGPRSRYAIIDTDEQCNVVGACLTPAGLPTLVAPPAQELAESDVALADLWKPRDVARLRERLHEAVSADGRLDVLEAWLLARYHAREPHPVVAYALETFMRHPATARVNAVVKRSGFSARYLIDRFKADVGLGPKRFCRVRRFQLAIGRVNPLRDDWSAVAADCGFFDQAHLINEFRAFAGLSPTQYLDRRTTSGNHVTFLQSPDAVP